VKFETEVSNFSIKGIENFKVLVSKFGEENCKNFPSRPIYFPINYFPIQVIHISYNITSFFVLFFKPNLTSYSTTLRVINSGGGLELNRFEEVCGPEEV